MTRLAHGRDTHLTRQEIVDEALRQFDEDPRGPSIRRLAAALGVAPTAIYHHYPSQASIVQAAVEKVWEEVNDEGLRLVPEPFDAEPRELLVSAGLATRRGWMRHHRLAPYLTATPEATGYVSRALVILGFAFEQLGYSGEEAARAFHAYATFTLGSVLFAAARQTAAASLDGPAERFHSDPTVEGAEHLSDPMRRSLDAMVDISVADPQRDEDLFVLGLRRIIDSGAPAG